MKYKNLVPIVLFVYNRPLHTKQTIEALQKNELANESELFIYSDAPKNNEAQSDVDEIREYVKSINGFKKVTIIERDKNWGLANSIIDGVSSIVNQYGKVIVLEDDLVTSPYFLKFMNEALEFYENEKRVWHISGWNYPIEADDSNDVFLWRVMNCWGWATWADRWQHYERDIDKTIATFSKKEIKKFNLDGVENFWSQVIDNKEKRINTWAIFWYATIFKNNGLCLNPTQTYVDNIGLDGSGIHCGVKKGYEDRLNLKQNIVFLDDIIESSSYVQKIQNIMRGNLLKRVKRFVKKMIKRLR
jgi:hypothetical protein